MQYSFLAIATLIATVTAQNAASGVPGCATTCLNQLPKECGTQDIGCICADKVFITNVSCCVAQNCPPDQQAAGLTFAKGICQAAGVSLTVTGATCIGSATSGSATSTSASTSASTTGAGSSSNTAVTTTTNLAASASSVSSSADSVLSSISSRISSASSGGAAPQVTAFAGLFGAAAAAVALL